MIVTSQHRLLLILALTSTATCAQVKVPNKAIYVENIP